jgi:hypothetical protein
LSVNPLRPVLTRFDATGAMRAISYCAKGSLLQVTALAMRERRRNPRSAWPRPPRRNLTPTARETPAECPRTALNLPRHQRGRLGAGPLRPLILEDGHDAVRRSSGMPETAPWTSQSLPKIFAHDRNVLLMLAPASRRLNVGEPTPGRAGPLPQALP